MLDQCFGGAVYVKVDLYATASALDSVRLRRRLCLDFVGLFCARVSVKGHDCLWNVLGRMSSQCRPLNCATLYRIAVVRYSNLSIAFEYLGVEHSGKTSTIEIMVSLKTDR